MTCIFSTSPRTKINDSLNTTILQRTAFIRSMLGFDCCFSKKERQQAYGEQSQIVACVEANRGAQRESSGLIHSHQRSRSRQRLLVKDFLKNVEIQGTAAKRPGNEWVRKDAVIEAV